jgi:translation initiation factor IF-2
MEEGRGAVANILIQQGKLKVGDFIVAGSRASVASATSPTTAGNASRRPTRPCPCRSRASDEVPDAGDKFYVVDSLKKAEEAAEQRRHREREAQLAAAQAHARQPVQPDGRQGRQGNPRRPQGR